MDLFEALSKYNPFRSEEQTEIYRQLEEAGGDRYWIVFDRHGAVDPEASVSLLMEIIYGTRTGDEDAMEIDGRWTRVLPVGWCPSESYGYYVMGNRRKEDPQMKFPFMEK